MSEREAAKEFGLARETVRKMLRYAVPPSYRRQQPVRRPTLDAWVGTIDQILEDDKARGKKQIKATADDLLSDLLYHRLERLEEQIPTGECRVIQVVFVDSDGSEELGPRVEFPACSPGHKPRCGGRTPQSWSSTHYR
jgi:hypothetical protein